MAYLQEETFVVLGGIEEYVDNFVDSSLHDVSDD
jgi:hypothetical protein